MASLRLRPSPLFFTSTIRARQPQLQLLLLPSLIKQLYRQCSCKQKSSGPVRYIPKARKHQDSETPSTFGKRTETLSVTEKSSQVHGYAVSAGTKKEGSSTSTSRNCPERMHRFWKESQSDCAQEETDVVYFNHKQEPGTVENPVEGKVIEQTATERGQYFSHSEHGLHTKKSRSLPRTSLTTERASLDVVQDMVSQVGKICIPEQIQTGQGLVQPSQLCLYPRDDELHAGRPQDATPNEKGMHMAYNMMMSNTHNSNRAKNSFHMDDDDSFQGFDDIFYEGSIATNGSLEIENIFHPSIGEEYRDTDEIFSELQPIGDGQTERIRKAEVASNASRVDAKNQAVRLLAMQPLTAFQLKKKLGLRKVSPELIDFAVADVQSCGMQNDADYAETFAQSRWSGRSWGPQKIKQALKLRGVSEEKITTALHHVFQEDVDQDFMGEHTHGISKLAKEQLMIQASKQWNRGRNIPEDKRVQRIIRWLQYRGFNWTIIRDVLKFLQKKSP